MSLEEDRALLWWFGHTRETELGVNPDESLVAMVRVAADERGNWKGGGDG